MEADELRITLPNGVTLHLSDAGDPSGFLLAEIPAGEGFFEVRPGAANLMLINAARE
ncbi:hypothetical protein [Streptomyces sp. NRRL F-5755]|uniref:hypothetical protein n=1 Tax=Streptomyces sp. NRRL F-5755 TaxID=1519475 RepID=UPI00133193DD|nr:hypothetical protein [Streptomyces sp. NRRL F-5755]